MAQRPRPRTLLALLALTAAPCGAQDAALERLVQQTLAAARPALVDHLKAAMRRDQRPGELALLCLAGLHDGLAPDGAPLQRALARLGKAKPTQTYDLALRLLVLQECSTFPGRQKLAKADLKKLLRHRCDEGAFQYHDRPGGWDLSNTQYGALGLRAARAMGLQVRRDVWTKLAREVSRSQAPDGGFCYAPRVSSWDPYPSMTVAGVAVLAICRQALGDAGERVKELDRRIEDAWAWLDQHRDAIGSPQERWSYYFHYGLERAAILCDVAKVGGRTDWYAKGAEMLVEQQLSGGGWSSSTDGHPGHHLSNRRGDSVPTAFAILFLRRKFQKHPGPITQRVVRLVNIGPRSKAADVEECARQLVEKGKAAMPEVVRAMRSDVAPQRQVAAKVLDAVVGERFGFDPDADRDENRSAVKKAELWYLKNR
ncbi:MAG: prenyltransferase/squalene oxidase repeat-containing protein [Planctomycetota bacterium]